MGKGADRMKASLETFRREMRVALQETLPEMVADVQVALAIDLVDKLSAGNPVRTGYSRINWQVEIGSIPQAPIEAVRLIGARKKSAKLTEAQAASVRRQVMARVSSTLSQVTKPVLIGISNPVEYVEYLEEGASPQKPNGWIVDTIDAFRARFADKVALGMAKARL